MSVVDNYHTNCVMCRPCSNRLNQGKKCFHEYHSFFDDEKTLHRCRNVSSSQLEWYIQTCHHPVKCCIISSWHMICALCGTSVINDMSCMLHPLKRCCRNWYHIVPNALQIFGMNAIVIAIDVVCKVGKSFQTPTNATLFHPYWLCTQLGHIMKGLHWWSWFFHLSLHRN
jgi:hypothetical protein